MSYIGDVFADAGMPLLNEHLGDTVAYESVDEVNTFNITLVFNEFVGAIDRRARAIFTGASADFDAQSVTPRRQDKFTLAGDTWSVIDVRYDNAGTYELRCDRTLEDN